MPDDMLEDSIAIAKKTLDEHDFETDGVEVSTFKSLTLFLNDICCRLRERSRSTWMTSGSLTGTFS